MALREAKTLAAEIAAHLQILSHPNTANVRALRREFSRHLAQAEPKLIMVLAFELLRGGEHLLRFVAYELLAHHRTALQSLRATDLTRLGRGMDSWGAVDMFACYLSGPVWRERQIPDQLIERWAQSKDRWWRRAALVSTVPLNRKALGGSGDAKRTLRICRMLAQDRDDMVVKALSWALRDLIKHDANAVRAFIQKHESVLAARVLREVRNKLKTGLKNPRQKKKRND